MASQLPEDVWSLILQHVPVADRLQHCALVSKKLSRAAAAATDALEVSVPFWRFHHQQQRTEAFDSYLQHHGSHVTSLVLDSAGQALTQLPCPKLLHLAISFVSPVQLGFPGVLDSCATGLTSLNLSYCTVATEGGGLSGLSVLVKLRDLEVQYVRQPDGVNATLPGSVLPSLTHLTRLELSHIGVEDVHHVSSLTNLYVLGIWLDHLSDPLLAPDIAPGFALPGCLQQLNLGRGVVLDPAVFAAATQLTSVELMCTRVELQGGGVTSGAALLAAVAGLQQLDTLELRELGGVAWPAPCAAYTALTASSKLQQLVVRDCRLPVGVWEHAFPPARRCPALRELLANDMDYPLGASAVSSLVRCFPGLQDLNLRVSGGEPVAALEPLTEALTSLVLIVGDPADQTDVADLGVSAQRIAALTRLQRLTLDLSAAGGDAADTAAAAGALLPLSALRGLTWCHVSLQSVQANGIGNRLVDFLVNNKADPGQPPDVWLQVLEQCLKASNCQPAAISVAKQQAQRAAQQEQLSGQLQQRAAEQEQVTGQLQQQVAELKQQQAVRAAQQDQQIAALQAQVQQLLQLLPQPVEQ